MRRRTKVVIGVVAGVVALGAAGAIVGPIVYANSQNQRAEAEPTLAPTASGDATISASDADGTWTAGSGSYAGYRVHEVLNGNDVQVTGRTTSVEGTTTIADGSITAGKLTVQVGDIATDEAARDSYFRDSALDTSSFPTATFELTGPVDVSSALSGDGAAITLPGKLTVHGVTKDVEASAQVGISSSGKAQVVGSIPITFADYGVQAPSLGFVKVDPKGSVEFSLDLTK
jgi:polyisoprenoid-binding protein YceI